MLLGWIEPATTLLGSKLLKYTAMPTCKLIQAMVLASINLLKIFYCIYSFISY